MDEGVAPVVAIAAGDGIDITSKAAIRWCRTGVGGCVLESVKVGGRRMTSKPAFRRFIEATQGRSLPGDVTPMAGAAPVALD